MTLAIDQAGAIEAVTFADSVTVAEHFRTKLRGIVRRWGYSRLIETVGQTLPADTLRLAIDWEGQRMTVDASRMISQTADVPDVHKLVAVTGLDVKAGAVKP